MMEVDQIDFGEEFAEDLLPDDEDIEMDGSFLHSPRMALADLFDELANQTTTPCRNPRRGAGWSCADLGGDGLCMESFFEDDVTKTTVAPSADKLPPTLGTIQWDDLQNMHPNKIFAISIEYIVHRAPQVAQVRRVKGGKVKPWRRELAMLAKDPMRELDFAMNARLRGDAYYTMVAWISRLSGRSIRVVKQEMADEWLIKRKWKDTDDKVKRRFHFLREIEK